MSHKIEQYSKHDGQGLAVESSVSASRLTLVDQLWNMQRVFFLSRRDCSRHSLKMKGDNKTETKNTNKINLKLLNYRSFFSNYYLVTDLNAFILKWYFQFLKITNTQTPLKINWLFVLNMHTTKCRNWW